VAPHHEHQDGQARLVEFGKARFDLVDGVAQVAFEAGVLVEADGALGGCHIAIPRGVVVQPGAERCGTLDRIVGRQRRQHGFDRRQSDAELLDHPVMACNQLFVAAEQEFGIDLVGPQKALREVVDQHLEACRHIGVALQHLLGAQSGKIDAADQQNATGSQQCNLPAQTQSKGPARHQTSPHHHRNPKLPIGGFLCGRRKSIVTNSAEFPIFKAFSRE
jgi:hypothetical protein